MTKYVLVYDDTLVRNNGLTFTKIIGPFDSSKEAADWHLANTPADVAVIDTIAGPDSSN